MLVVGTFIFANSKLVILADLHVNMEPGNDTIWNEGDKVQGEKAFHPCQRSHQISIPFEAWGIERQMSRRSASAREEST